LLPVASYEQPRHLALTAPRVATCRSQSEQVTRSESAVIRVADLMEEKCE